MNSSEHNSIIDIINKHELLKHYVKNKSEHIKILKNDNKILQDENEQARIYSEKLYEDIINLKMEIEQKDKKLSESINTIENDNKILQDENEQAQIFSIKLYDDIIKLSTEIDSKDKKLSEYLNHIKELQNKLQNKLQNEIENKEDSIKKLQNKIEDKEHTINCLQINIENKEGLIKEDEIIIQNTEYVINTLQNNIEKNERYIKELEIVIKCYQKYSNNTRSDENVIPDFSTLKPSRFDTSSKIVNKEYEKIIINNILKAKTDEFLWTAIDNAPYTHVFDLYKNFDDVIKHIKRHHISVQYNYSYELVEKQLTNMRKLKDDEYFIGVYYGNVYVSNYLQTYKGDDSFSYNLIFYTNYGNIIDFSFKRHIVSGGGRAPIILDIKYYYNYKKLDITFINHLNLIIAKREKNTQSFIDITSQELNNIILSLYGVISHSVINSIPITKTNEGIGWRQKESLVHNVQSRRKSVMELGQQVNL